MLTIRRPPRSDARFRQTNSLTGATSPGKNAKKYYSILYMPKKPVAVMPIRVALPKSPTGIQGLDEITGGGLPTG